MTNETSSYWCVFYWKKHKVINLHFSSSIFSNLLYFSDQKHSTFCYFSYFLFLQNDNKAFGTFFFCIIILMIDGAKSFLYLIVWNLFFLLVIKCLMEFKLFAFYIEVLKVSFLIKSLISFGNALILCKHL